MRQKTRGERKQLAALADADARGACFLDMGGDSAPAPDYTPVAQASEAAARITAEQADRVLTESRRQYDRNMEVAQPIIDAQVGMMRSAQQQGDEYYSYWKSRAQPVEDALNADAMAAGTAQKQDEAVARAVADSQGGYTRALNQGLRQARRYGTAPAAATGTMAVLQAQNTAGAATAARDKEIALGAAKKLDVAGLYRGMPGASAGAYGAATNAGNSAVGNSTAVGQGLTNGTIASAGIVSQGQQMRLQGLGAVLGAQQNAYNASLSQSNQGFGSLMSGLGGLGQGLGALKAAGFFAASDRRLKENVERVGETAHGLGLYEFNYIGEPQRRLRGVMADEVEAVMPAAVGYDSLGFAAVDYDKLGIRLEEV